MINYTEYMKIHAVEVENRPFPMTDEEEWEELNNGRLE